MAPALPAALMRANVALLSIAVLGATSTTTSDRVALLILLSIVGAGAAHCAPDAPSRIRTAVVAVPVTAIVAAALLRDQALGTLVPLTAAVTLAVAASVLHPGPHDPEVPRLAVIADGIWCATAAAVFVAGVVTDHSLPLTTLLAVWLGVGAVAVVGKAVLLQPSTREARWPSAREALQPSTREARWPSAGDLIRAVVIPATALVALIVMSALLDDDAVGLLLAWGLLLPAALLASSARRGVPRLVAVLTATVTMVVLVTTLPYQVGAWLFGENATLAAPTLVLVALTIAAAAGIDTVAAGMPRDAATVLGALYAAATAVAVGVAITAAKSAVAVGFSTALAAVFTCLAAVLWSRTLQTRTPTADAALMSLVTAERSPRGAALPLDSLLRTTVWRGPGDALAGMAFLVLTAVVLPAIVVGMTGPAPNASWWWPMPGVLLASLRLSWVIASRERRLFEAMFWIFSYSFLGLAAVAQLRDNLWPPTVPRMDDQWVAAASVLILVCNICFLAGAVLEGLQRRVATVLRPLQSRPTVAGSGPRFSISYPRLLILSAGAILLNAYYLSEVGVIQFLESRDEAFEDYEKVWSPGTIGVMVRAATYMALLVAIVALVRWRKEAKAAIAAGIDVPVARMRLNVALMVVVGVLTANSMNPISNARYQAGTAILSALAILGVFATTRRYRLAMTGFLLALLVVFPFADAFRTSRSFTLKANNPVDSLASADYDSFAQIMNSMLIVSRDGIHFLHQIIGVPLFWVPRPIWPDKPVDTGIFIANQRGYGFTNLSAPWWGEIFINGGWALAVVVMALMGYGLHKWDTKIDRDLGMFGVPSILGSIYPFLLMIFLRGSLIQATPYFVFSAVCALFVTVWRRRGPASPPQPIGPPASIPEVAYARR